MLQQWLFPQINYDFENFVFQPDGAPLHWHRHIRSFLNKTLPQRWILAQNPKIWHYTSGRQDHQTLHSAIFSWGHIKDGNRLVTPRSEFPEFFQHVFYVLEKYHVLLLFL